MLAFGARAAVAHTRRAPLAPVLAAVALALGCAAALIPLTAWRLQTAHPAPQHEGRLFNVQIDPAPQNDTFRGRGGFPTLLTWRDASALLRLDAAPRQVAMYMALLPAIPAAAGGQGLNPSRAISARVRFTSADFFAMFQPGWHAGGGWDSADDTAEARIAVLSHAASLRLFNTPDAVGRVVELGGEPVRIIGVLQPWQPAPRYYDPTELPYQRTDDVFMPLRVGIGWELRSGQSNNCYNRAAMGPSYDDFLQGECVWLNGWVELPSAKSGATFRAALRNYLQAEHAAGRAVHADLYRLRSVRDWLDQFAVVDDSLGARLALSGGFALLCLLNAAILLTGWFAPRERLYALHRSLGARRHRLAGQCLAELTLIGAAAGLLCVPLVWLGLWFSRSEGLAMSRLIPPHGLPDMLTAAYTVLAPTLCAVLAGAWPLWRAARTQPLVRVRAARR